jgi:hypothetical protein
VSADPYDAVQDARSDRGEWTEGDVADDAAEAFRWGYGATEDASGEATR